jgi:hypothetical protein
MNKQEEKQISPELMAEFMKKLPDVKKTFMAIAGDSKLGTTPLEKFILAALHVFGKLQTNEIKTLYSLFVAQIRIEQNDIIPMPNSKKENNNANKKDN